MSVRTARTNVHITVVHSVMNDSSRILLTIISVQMLSNGGEGVLSSFQQAKSTKKTKINAKTPNTKHIRTSSQLPHRHHITFRITHRRFIRKKLPTVNQVLFILDFLSWSGTFKCHQNFRQIVLSPCYLIQNQTTGTVGCWAVTNRRHGWHRRQGRTGTPFTQNTLQQCVVKDIQLWNILGLVCGYCMGVNDNNNNVTITSKAP